MIRFSVYADDRFHWRPRWMYRKSAAGWESKYFGHKWYLLVWFLWWEFELIEPD
jgi:hypothetical protein